MADAPRTGLLGFGVGVAASREATTNSKVVAGANLDLTTKLENSLAAISSDAAAQQTRRTLQDTESGADGRRRDTNPDGSRRGTRSCSAQTPAGLLLVWSGIWYVLVGVCYGAGAFC